MDETYYLHTLRFPKNAPGPFYSLGHPAEDGTWMGECLQCHLPEDQAPNLLAALEGENGDTYFVRQPSSNEEIEQACRALESCCVDALRYGGSDPRILERLKETKLCDQATVEPEATTQTIPLRIP